MQSDLKRAAEHICAQRPPAQASAAETAIGFDPRSLARWTAGRIEAWLDYTEDGPWEIARLLRKKLIRRAGKNTEALAAVGQGMGGAEGGGALAAAAAAGRHGNPDWAHPLARSVFSGVHGGSEAAPARSPALSAPLPMSPPHLTPVNARALPKTPRFDLSSPDFSSPSDSTPGLPTLGRQTPGPLPAQTSAAIASTPLASTSLASPALASPAAPPVAAQPTAATLVPNLMD
jgi:hypothetical protein